MMRAAVLIASLVSSAAYACPEPSGRIPFHSCWGEARAALLLLPEEQVAAETDSRHKLVVTGAYTGVDVREDGRPNPVGVFLHRGQLVNPQVARMDGVLIVEPRTGAPTLHHRARIALEGARYALDDPAQRSAFYRHAQKARLSVIQSHLLIVDGKVDVRMREDAPRYLRRILFTDEHGWGIYETRLPLTLEEATQALAREHAPRMALNLDMGSYDYCLHVEMGEPRRCGYRDIADTSGLSNLLAFWID